MRGKRFSENQALNLLPVSASLTLRSTASLGQWGKGCSSQMMYQGLHVYYCVEVPQPTRHSRALLAHLGSERERRRPPKVTQWAPHSCSVCETSAHWPGTQRKDLWDHVKRVFLNQKSRFLGDCGPSWK